MKSIYAVERRKNLVTAEINRLKDVCEDLGLNFNEIYQNCENKSVDKIIEMLKSEEFKKYPELFTKNVISTGNLDEIKKLLNSKVFKEHPELFTATTLSFSTLEDIRDLINSEEFKKYPHLFTSQTIAKNSIKEIRKILDSKEFKEHPELFTSETLAYANIEKISEMINSDEYRNHPQLFTSTTLAHGDMESIRGILNLPDVKNGKYTHVITSTILAKGKGMLKKLPIQFKLAEENGFDKNITVNFLLKSPSENYAIIKYMQEHNIPIVTEKGTLHNAFRSTPRQLVRELGITRDQIMEKYPFEMEVKQRQIKEPKVEKNEMPLHEEKKDKVETYRETEQTNNNAEKKLEEMTVEELLAKLQRNQEENRKKEQEYKQKLIDKIMKEQQRSKELDEANHSLDIGD